MYLQGIMLRHRNKKCIQVRKFTRRLKCQMDVQRMTVSKKVKVTPVRALRLCTGRTAHSGSRGIALLFHCHGTRRGEGLASRPGGFSSRERIGTHCTGGWVGPRVGLDRCGKYRPHRESIPGPSSP